MHRRTPGLYFHLVRATCLTLLVSAGAAVDAEDWPTYGHDPARTSATSERISFPLSESWSWRAPIVPKATWDEPAVWDGWHKIYNLRNRVDFDKAFHVAVVGDRAWFGSSVDDQLYCVNLQTGELEWTFFTEGPIRLAPVAADGKIYFGSDDGHVYCLAQADGQLHWKHRIAPGTMRVSGNGRLISRWPVRTSVAVIDGSCYAAAGVFPTETVYLAALDAETGEEQWLTEQTDLPAQGYLLASPTRLYVFPGRGGPVIFDRASGQRLKHIDSTGGTYALLVDETLVTTTGRDGRSLQAVDSAGADRLATFPGVHMIMDGPMSYLQSDTELTAINRREYVELTQQRQGLEKQHAALKKKFDELPKENEQRAKLADQISELEAQIADAAEQLQECWEWKTPCATRSSLILAGDTLISGGNGIVTGFNVRNGRQTFQIPVEGNAYGLAAANGRLVVSTDRGVIHAFERATSANPPPTNSGGEQTSPYAGMPTMVAPEAANAHAVGPFLRFSSPTNIEVVWQTRTAVPTRLAFAEQGMESAVLLEQDEPTTDHVVEAPVAEGGPLFSYWVGGVDGDGNPAWHGPHEFDALLNYAPPELPEQFHEARSETPEAQLCRAAAQDMLAAADVQRGYALVLGGVDGSLALELVRQSDLKVVVLESDASRVAKLRQTFAEAGVYGHRVAVIEGSVDSTRIAPYLANLITSERLLLEGKLPGRPADYASWLAPSGGTLWLGVNSEAELLNGQLPGWTDAAGVPLARQTGPFEGGRTWIARRQPLEGAGEWTHQYGLPDNAACSRDDCIRGSMEVLWWGRPGARPMPDRGGRNPAPVSAGGRLFVQGNRTLFGLDAYNGTILWARQNPTMRRANVPRDGSNMVASEDLLYVAIEDAAIAFDAATGDVALDLPVRQAAQLPGEDRSRWGYAAVVGDRLIGTAVAPGGQYVGDEGEWYEEFSEEVVRRVESPVLFSVDRHTGEPHWRYAQGAVMNSTITIADGTAYFIESRPAETLPEASRRPLEATLSDQHLVALDLKTGEVRWEKPFDFSQCQFMTYVCHSAGKLIVTGTDKEKVFHTFAFADNSGKLVWDDDAKARKLHHSGHLAHPTIVGDRLYFNKLTYDLHTGEILEEDDFDWHGCGVMAASNHTIFSRFEFHGMHDLQTDERFEFLGLRSGCWLNIIPSGGLLLAPEMSSGCSCSHSLQTSVAFIPKEAVDNKQ